MPSFAASSCTTRLTSAECSVGAFGNSRLMRRKADEERGPVEGEEGRVAFRALGASDACTCESLSSEAEAAGEPLSDVESSML